MNRKGRRILLNLCCLSLWLPSCAKVAVTGRRQLNLIPSAMMFSMSFQQYQEFLNEAKVSQDTSEKAMVDRVGRRIQGAVEQYFAQMGRPEVLKDYAWEFTLIESQEVNAWVLPGGKVVVYTGLLPVAQNDAGLATVLGHEIAHAIANHGGERMSHALLVELGGVALDTAMKEKPEQTRELFQTAFGVGSTVGVLLPFSRLQESEADHMGLIFMAMAGYDPHAAVDFWQRMSEANKGGSSTPELLSTHPADKRRVENIKSLLPEAMQYYKPASGG
ncbi:MAG: M48 family metallopeptidase [Sedimentisphaerales bacterium]|nr:M48 family metallopeptidase [Sedimentisphaerales bacterium]